VKSERIQLAKFDSRIVPLGLNSKLQQLHGPCVKDGGQKPEMLMREVGCKHEEQSNANSLKTLLESSHGSNQDRWCQTFGQQWNTVFRPRALVVNWHKPREKKALEHVAHRLILWLDATHEGERISINKIHEATAKRPDLQRRLILTFRQK